MEENSVTPFLILGFSSLPPSLPPSLPLLPDKVYTLLDEQGEDQVPYQRIMMSVVLLLPGDDGTYACPSSLPPAFPPFLLLISLKLIEIERV